MINPPPSLAAGAAAESRTKSALSLTTLTHQLQRDVHLSTLPGGDTAVRAPTVTAESSELCLVTNANSGQTHY